MVRNSNKNPLCNGAVGETNDRERFFSENFQKSRGMNYNNFPDMNLSVGCVLFQI